jgi:hypothetical protein
MMAARTIIVSSKAVAENLEVVARAQEWSGEQLEKLWEWQRR